MGTKMTVSSKIGIDFHGVITEAPDFFRDFTRLATVRGHEIYVISGGSAQMVRPFLENRGIVWQHLFSLMDYFADLGCIEYLAGGDFHVPEDLWNKAKADYCRRNAIDIHIDDTPAYGTFFVTPFCLYDKVGRTCCLGEREVDFGGSPVQALTEVENFIAAQKTKNNAE